MHVVAAIDQAPGQARRLRNVTELAALAIPRSNSAAGAPFFIGMDLRRWRPEIGAKVVAYGFADLDVGEADADADVARPISQYLYGSAALITDIEPEDRSRGRPWPFFRVDRDWPSGMSGGRGQRRRPRGWRRQHVHDRYEQWRTAEPVRHRQHDLAPQPAFLPNTG